MKLEAITRTYAHAFQGNPTYMFFSTNNASFTTSYDVDTSITMPTEVYLHKKLFYPDGYTLTVSNDNKGKIKDYEVTSKEDENYLQVMIDKAYDGFEVSLLLTPTIAMPYTATHNINDDYSLTTEIQVQSDDTPECGFLVNFADGVGTNIEVWLINKDGA